MQKLILIITVSCLMRVAIAQGQSGSCANEFIPFSAYPKYGKILHPKAQYALGGVNYVPIKLHVLRTNAGTTSFDHAVFMESFMELNRNFKDINIQFYIVPQINYINNTAFYDLNADQEEGSLCSANDVNDALNLYLTNSIVFSYGFNATGYAYYPSPSAASNRVFITNTSLNSGGRTLTHELGHYFNLLHTFNGNNNPDINLRELVTRGSGSNCITTGDLLCDTPADPYGLSGASTSGCSYTGNLIDANGARFTPSMSNTMSYYSEICGSEFSVDQFERLSEGYVFRNSPDNQYTIQYTDPAVTKPTGLVADASQAGITLTFEDNANNEFGYIAERSTDAAGIFEPIKACVANVESIIDQDLSSNTTYYYRIRAANGIEFSNVAEATTGTFYCTPTYQQTCNNFQVVIEQFSIAGTSLSNINSGCSPDNYGKFTNMVADLTAGSSYTFTASATTTTNVPFYAQALSVWADFNQDGIFETSERVYSSTTTAPSSGMNPSVTALINIPENAKPGFTVLRARTQYGVFGNVTSPCDELIMGETEDYTINIVSPMQNNTVAVTSISPLAVCRGSSFTVGYETTGSGFSGNTVFTVQIDNGAGQFINLPTQRNGSGSLTATIPTSLASGSNFNIRILATNPDATSPVSSSKITVNAVPITPTLAINGLPEICVGGSISVNAVGCTGTVNWSNNLTGNPITFTVNEPITITASCSSNGCTGSTSTPLSISTKPRPNAPVINLSSTNSTVCSGEVVSLNASSCTGTVTWSNGSTGNSISFSATSSVLLSATCRVNGCESSSSNSIQITVKSKPSPPLISTPTTSYCVGEVVNLAAQSCTGTVTWSNGSTGNSISFSATSSVLLSATCTVNGCESSSSNSIQITVNGKPSPPIISVAGGSLNHCPNESVELIATNCAGTINWSNGATGSRTTVVVASSTSYSATCTVSTCASNSSNFITFTCTPTGSKMKVVALDLNVILEGPYNQATGLMSTRYNSQGLLPGQTPVSQFGVPTPAGQPYNRSPWNYSGSENVVNYEPTVVGWLLVSVKNQGNTILYQTAALLHADTHVEFIKDFPELDTTVTYFLQVDHRNHLGVMSATMLPVTNGKIKYNFTASDSYIKPNTPAFGQKLIGTKYAMFVGDIDKSSPAQHYDINFADITKLRNNVGLFEQYLDADLNLDADINFNDLIIWRANSGKFSSITY